MKTMDQKAGFVLNRENFDAVAKQLTDARHEKFLEESFTMVQRNRKGNNKVPEENIRNWARRVFKK